MSKTASASRSSRHRARPTPHCHSPLARPDRNNHAQAQHDRLKYYRPFGRVIRTKCPEGGTSRGSSYAVHYHFDPEALADSREFRLVLRTKGPEGRTTRVFRLHRRGTSLSDAWKELSALGDRRLTRHQVGNWPDMPLTPWP